MPPHSRVISLHAHSVAAAMHSFMYNISHTPRKRSPQALPCSSNGKTAAEKKETANKADLNPKIRKCSHWCGDLISCYTVILYSLTLWYFLCYLHTSFITNHDFISRITTSWIFDKYLYLNIYSNYSIVSFSLNTHFSCIMTNIVFKSYLIMSHNNFLEFFHLSCVWNLVLQQ